MSADREVQELLREFRQRGLQNLMSNPPASAPYEVTPLALNQPMQTRSTRKKFKVEVRSKRNEERQKPKDPAMHPPGSAELPPEGFEDFITTSTISPTCR